MTERKLLFLMNAEQAQEFARLVRAAEAGDGGAACRLGDLYREGRGGLRYSPKETHRWYARSAMTGYANGQNNLGACYEHGIGCRQSYAKAVKWYRLAAAQKLGTASMNLGYCYLRGKAVTADRAEALRLFRLAVKQGEPKAADELERLGEPLEDASAAPTVTFKDVTRSGTHLGMTALPPGRADADDEPEEPKKHVPADKEWLFDVWSLAGHEVEDFDDETAPRYREYLARKGLTKDDLARRRRFTDVQRRAWEKDDCFDLPPEGSEYAKRLRALGDRIMEQVLRNGAGQDQPHVANAAPAPATREDGVAATGTPGPTR